LVAGEAGASREGASTGQSDAHGRETDRGSRAEASRAAVDTLVAEGASLGVAFNADSVGAVGDEPPAEASSRVAAHAVVQSVSQQLSEHAAGLRRDGAHSWVVHVEPDEYGAVRVELVLQDQRVSADIVTSHSVVKDLFLHHQGELRHALAEHGFRVDRFSVNVGDPGQQSQDRWLDQGPRFWPEREGRPELDSRSNSPRLVESVGASWSESGVWQTVNVYV
jgi:flagellar hook-length control protein FliK